MFKIKKIVIILLIINLCNLPSINSNSVIDFLLSNKRKIAVTGLTIYAIYKVLTKDQEFVHHREYSEEEIRLKERIHQDVGWYNYFSSFFSNSKKDFNEFVLKIGPQLQKTCRYALDDNIQVHNSRRIEKDGDKINHCFDIEKAPKNQEAYWKQLRDEKSKRREERVEEKGKAEKEKVEEKSDRGDSKSSKAESKRSSSSSSSSKKKRKK